ncbi:hypothetical protein DFH27DRAFT_313030 [Peziza echinospora]|nr:hypothetical protein DFH27DRAFT_313030 [Peziza echinospora]
MAQITPPSRLYFILFFFCSVRVTPRHTGAQSRQVLRAPVDMCEDQSRVVVVIKGIGQVPGPWARVLGTSLCVSVKHMLELRPSSPSIGSSGEGLIAVLQGYCVWVCSWPGLLPACVMEPSESAICFSAPSAVKAGVAGGSVTGKALEDL